MARRVAAGGRAKLITPQDAADRLAVSRDQVYKLYHVGRLAGCKVGRSVRILESAVSELIAGGLARAAVN